MHKAGIALLLAGLAAPTALAAGVVTSCAASTQSGIGGIIGNKFLITINGASDPHNNLCGTISNWLTLETNIVHFDPPININIDGLSCDTTKQPDPFKTVFLNVILDKHSPSDQLSAFKSALFDTFNNDPAFGGNLPEFNCDLSDTIA
ncbi:hypothetical protein NQ176_g1368 [Zarea fungicola]|uniref:Uncharacterized protein n=1 Tax=Zarea fungicola TaxID=93591 RepID=A0ACC1NT35_9HYPO|nr:hypothetical protein NQ176_g1368 [Lecanicillium fungicola]